MKIAQSKLTARGRASIPAKVRQHLGVEPGSVLEWYDDGGRVMVRRVVRYSSEDIHRALFAKPPKGRTLRELKAGARQAVTNSRAR